MATFYAMRMVQGTAVRVGKMSTDPSKPIRLAKRHAGGHVEQYGVGTVWTPGNDPFGLEQIARPGQFEEAPC